MKFLNMSSPCSRHFLPLRSKYSAQHSVLKLSLRLTKYHAKKTYWVSVYLHAFLTLALGGGEWSASRPGRFTSGERAPDTHWRRLDGPQSLSGRSGEEKNSLHCSSRERTPVVPSIA
jgi:hypothetical protein